MTELTLHYAPLSCAMVALIALEETGHPFEVEPVSLYTRENRGSGFLALSAKGKVPVLVIDGRPLTELVAILTWLAGRFPEAKLLPAPGDARGQAEVLADLAYCASTLQAFAPRIRLPQFFCDADPDRVRAQAIDPLRLQLEWIEARLAQADPGKGGWWYGDDWSVVDAHLGWIWSAVARPPGIDGAAFPNLVRHSADGRARPAVQRACAREAALLAESGISLDSLK